MEGGAPMLGEVADGAEKGRVAPPCEVAGGAENGKVAPPCEVTWVGPKMGRWRPHARRCSTCSGDAKVVSMLWRPREKRLITTAVSCAAESMLCMYMGRRSVAACTQKG